MVPRAILDQGPQLGHVAGTEDVAAEVAGGVGIQGEPRSRPPVRPHDSAVHVRRVDPVTVLPATLAHREVREGLVVGPERAVGQLAFEVLAAHLQGARDVCEPGDGLQLIDVEPLTPGECENAQQRLEDPVPAPSDLTPEEAMVIGSEALREGPRFDTRVLLHLTQGFPGDEEVPPGRESDLVRQPVAPLLREPGQPCGDVGPQVLVPRQLVVDQVQVREAPVRQVVKDPAVRAGARQDPDGEGLCEEPAEQAGDRAATPIRLGLVERVNHQDNRIAASRGVVKLSPVRSGGTRRHPCAGVFSR
ncbi:MAG TPA: hypothetical protein VH682_23490 [Gemmataceae bacterium]